MRECDLLSGSDASVRQPGDSADAVSIAHKNLDNESDGERSPIATQEGSDIPHDIKGGMTHCWDMDMEQPNAALQGKGHSFRRRRLTYAKHDTGENDITAAAAAAAAADFLSDVVCEGDGDGMVKEENVKPGPAEVEEQFEKLEGGEIEGNENIVGPTLSKKEGNVQHHSLYDDSEDGLHKRKRGDVGEISPDSSKASLLPRSSSKRTRESSSPSTKQLSVSATSMGTTATTSSTVITSSTSNNRNNNSGNISSNLSCNNSSSNTSKNDKSNNKIKARRRVRSMKYMHMIQGVLCRIRTRLLRTMPPTIDPTIASQRVYKHNNNKNNSANTMKKSMDTKCESIHDGNDHLESSITRKICATTTDVNDHHNNDDDGDEVFQHDHLPFSRDVVGTYSCHGIEPLYDNDDYGEDEDEEAFDEEEEGISEEEDGNNLSPTDLGDLREESMGEEDYANSVPTTLENASQTTLPTHKERKEKAQQRRRSRRRRRAERKGPSVIAKINQDRGGVAYPYGRDAHTALFAAYDGHGEGGEHVAQFAMTEIQRRLERHVDYDLNVERAFVQTFVNVDEDLVHEVHLDPVYSGTTACVVLMRERTLTIANTGDSRAVIARRRYNSKKKSLLEDDDAAAGGRGVSVNPHDVETTGPRASNKESDNSDQMIAVDLSVDQNPDSPGEQERIESCGGFVSPPPEEGLSARVWLDPDFTHIGLAMSRSIGDHAVKPVGVISEPVVTTYEITDDDEFMIIATDGVWEFIDSCEAVRIVNERLRKGRGASAACQALIETAALRWKEHEGSYRDDITAAVVKVKELWEDHSDQ